MDTELKEYLDQVVERLSERILEVKNANLRERPAGEHARIDACIETVDDVARVTRARLQTADQQAERLARRVSHLEGTIAGTRSIDASEFRAVNTQLTGLRHELRMATVRQDALDREFRELERSVDRLRTDIRERLRLLEQQVSDAKRTPTTV